MYEVRVDLVATSNVFGAGHRIRLEVSSSNFPRFDRNTNTGGVIARETVDDFQPALNRVHHGPNQPVPRGAADHPLLIGRSPGPPRWASALSITVLTALASISAGDEEPRRTLSR